MFKASEVLKQSIYKRAMTVLVPVKVAPQKEEKKNKHMYIRSLNLFSNFQESFVFSPRILGTL